MAEDTAPSSDVSKDALDLTSLSGLDFGPDWADGKPSKSPKHKYADDRGDRKGKGRKSGPPSRDRRSGGRPQRSGDDGSGGRPGGRGSRDTGPRHDRQNFEPTVGIDLYPQDEAFEALVKRLRASARTYQLFEIAHLLLEKPERYVVVVSQKKQKNDSGDAKPLLYYSVPGHLPFETEEQAIDYVLKEHMDLFFETEEVEIEAPSGNFQMVNRCGITGELLGPPNYHRYQQFVQAHYSTRISGMSLDRFKSKIESSKEQEDIDAWLESMKKGARYTVKDRQENEPESFDTLEAARHFLVTHRKDKVVGSGDHVRFAGRDIERMPKGNIRRSVEHYVEQQKHFPLDSANNIRGRLRRHKFAVYKKGSKGVSFVCAVKRKFRDSKTVFTDSISDLIDFIEKHPDIPASKLSKEYIGIDTEKQKPETLVMKETVEAPAAPGESAEVPEAAEAPSSANEADESAEVIETVEADPTVDTPEEPTAEIAPSAVETSTQATPKEELNEEDRAKLNQLMLDLRWLITEGYVTEYGDGRLFAPAPLPEPSKKDTAKPVVKDAEDAATKPSKDDSKTSTPEVQEEVSAESKSESNGESTVEDAQEENPASPEEPSSKAS